METEPYILDLEEVGLLMDEQEQIEKTLREQDIKYEEITHQNEDMEVKVQVRTKSSDQSNQVCLFVLIFLILSNIRSR